MAPVSLLGLATLTFVAGRAEAKEVLSLPGLKEKIGFRHYSGYLQASDTHFLHYWYVDAVDKADSRPLLLWMNGGPGCSSLDGLLSELGPFHIRDDGATIYLNPYSWNRLANVLFLEAPAGVGFSYSTDGNVTTNDDQTSLENYKALKHFFDLFPQRRHNDFYVTGESYGGIYVPTLVKRIIDGQSTFAIKLKGMAVGNGMLSFPLNTDTIVNFAYAHGLVDQKTWQRVEQSCCGGCADTCAFHNVSSTFCKNQVSAIMQETWSSGLNVYDLYRDCYVPTLVQRSRFLADMHGLLPVDLADDAFRRLAQTLARFTGSKKLSVPCLNDTAITTYLNRPDVRKALHIRADFGTWEVCSMSVSKGYHKVYTDMISQINAAIKAKLKILVYNGDTDMACNFLMGQRFVEQLGREVVRPKTHWIFKKRQIGGFITRYTGIDFVTVKGSGHMVPQFRPQSSFTMIDSFLNDKLDSLL